MKKSSVREHYDILIDEGNDPVYDPPVLESYMNKWDGQPFMDALLLSPQSDVLEIGIGTGRLAKKVLGAGCRHLTGIDISEKTIQRAKENLSAWENVELICGDFLECVLPQRFDVIYCSLTLFHFGDKRALFQKAAELLAEGGRLVISVPKEEEDAICYPERKVELYPDNIPALKTLFDALSLAIVDITEVEFANILTVKKL